MRGGLSGDPQNLVRGGEITEFIDAFRMFDWDHGECSQGFQARPLASAMSTYYSYPQCHASTDNEIGSLATISMTAVENMK